MASLVFGFLRSSEPPQLADPSAEAIAAHRLPDDAFAQLRAALGSSSGPRTRAIYFRAVWDLAWTTEPWFVLVDERSPAVAGLPPPCIAATGPVRVALAFSSKERADAGAHRLGLAQSLGRLGVLALPRDLVCNWLAGLASIDALVFNADEAAWLACLPMSDIVAEFERRFDRLTPRMVGRFGEAVNRGGRRGRGRCIARLFALPEWWFIATAARSAAPILLASHSGVVTIPVFTSPERARRGGDALVAGLREGVATPLPMEPRSGFSYLRRLHERERGTGLAILLDEVPEEVGEPAVLPLSEVIAAGEAIGW
jgi:hypothetical protein